MPTEKNLSMAAPWREIQVTRKDWAEADTRKLGSLLTNAHLIRAFEETVLEVHGEGLMHGPAHSSIGQEGGAVGSAWPLKAIDKVTGSHRGHHQFLAKALNYLAPEGLDPKNELPDALSALLKRTVAEIMGLSEGFCRGRGGSMHLRWSEAGALGTNAIVGGGVAMAAGAALAQRNAGEGGVVVAFFGDGAVNIGAVLETMNLAAAWSLPICFFIENNLYAVSTHVKEVSRETRLSSRGPAFGIPSWRVDGMNPLAVSLAMEKAVAHMRAGGGPSVVEAEVYRYLHQSGGLPGSAFGYRAKDEESDWRNRDPLDQLAQEMIRRDLLTREDVAGLRERARSAMHRALETLTERGGGNQRRVKPALVPKPDFRDVGLRGDLGEFAGCRFEERETFQGKLAAGKFVDAVAKVQYRRMEADPRVVVMGEDVHHLKGGTNGATRGLVEAFPERVMGTPISENAFTGLAGGLAMDGRMIPIVELMYPDFLWVAADQVFNQIGKARHMFGGDSSIPLVLRTKVAMGTGYGSQHSMDPAGLFATSPGWRILAPSTAFDYVGLMNSALHCQDPVLVIEHVDLYTLVQDLPAEDFDYFIPIGKAKVVREGAEVTVLSYLTMVQESVAVAERMGIDAEIIDLRTLDRAGIDWATIGASIRKTNAVLIVEQGAVGTSYGGFLVEEVQRRFFDWLDGPIQRVTGGEASPSVSRVLETAAIAGPDEIRDGYRRILGNLGRSLDEGDAVPVQGIANAGASL